MHIPTFCAFLYCSCGLSVPTGTLGFLPTASASPVSGLSPPMLYVLLKGCPGCQSVRSSSSPTEPFYCIPQPQSQATPNPQPKPHSIHVLYCLGSPDVRMSSGLGHLLHKPAPSLLNTKLEMEPKSLTDARQVLIH